MNVEVTSRALRLFMGTVIAIAGTLTAAVLGLATYAGYWL